MAEHYKSGMEQIQEVLEEILSTMGISYERIYIRRGELEKQLVFDILGGSASLLTRSGNDVLTALTTLTRSIIEKKSRGIDTNFSIDVGGYRSRKIRELQERALEAAEKVMSSGHSIELSPMSAFERKIVHTALEGNKKVGTDSVGVGINRRIVLKLRK